MKVGCVECSVMSFSLIHRDFSNSFFSLPSLSHHNTLFHTPMFENELQEYAQMLMDNGISLDNGDDDIFLKQLATPTQQCHLPHTEICPFHEWPVTVFVLPQHLREKKAVESHTMFGGGSPQVPTSSSFHHTPLTTYNEMSLYWVRYLHPHVDTKSILLLQDIHIHVQKKLHPNIADDGSVQLGFAKKFVFKQKYHMHHIVPLNQFVKGVQIELIYDETEMPVHGSEQSVLQCTKQSTHSFNTTHVIITYLFKIMETSFRHKKQCFKFKVTFTDKDHNTLMYMISPSFKVVSRATQCIEENSNPIQ